jgi:UDP-N-acetylglucosamine 2-epimerase (non-hydrolysing)
MSRRPNIETTLVHTGQHYDYEMSRVFFEELGIPEPDINLEVGSGTAVKQAAEIMLRLERVMEETQPDVVVVVGDVNSTLAGALTAAKTGRPIAHVEAGLRSFDRTMPEEVNRVLTDAVSDFLFVTEPSGVENLRKEGRPKERIFFVGNVLIDALRRFLPHAKRFQAPAELGARGNHMCLAGPYGLVTLHRPSNVDNLAALRSIWTALNEIAKYLPLIFPVHPRTQDRLRGGGLCGSWEEGRNGLHLVPPMNYLLFLKLLSDATLVITDSGGIQEETTALGVPCLTLRENTERPITISEGTNVLVGVNCGRLVQEAQRILRGEGKKGHVPELWDGRASARIVHTLVAQIGADHHSPAKGAVCALSGRNGWPTRGFGSLKTDFLPHMQALRVP